ncbi:hypothetical protein F0562_015532 [Nyssa sinensis]|uniref:Uncharacterized protein n=1 Tax=Nyssa sinensis TaxID=561372 RepID=A0A5J4ZKI1_9ASTE|nr:hypothetical protein F0562_015532 [Nyssa sinensis]
MSLPWSGQYQEKALQREREHTQHQQGLTFALDGTWIRGFRHHLPKTKNDIISLAPSVRIRQNSPFKNLLNDKLLMMNVECW